MGRILARVALDASAVLNAFATANPGFLVRVEWQYTEKVQRGDLSTITWNGRFVGMTAGTPSKARVFYWMGQEDMPPIRGDAPGFEVAMPREGVTYYQVRLTNAVPLSR